MFHRLWICFAIPIGMATLTGCSTPPPNQPSVLVLPGDGKSFDQFRADNELCKQFAQDEVNSRSPQDAATTSGVSSAIVGTILGAAAGVAVDGRGGAGPGAGAGLALGGLAGVGAADRSSSRQQERYDIGYQQCMYAQGHRLPPSDVMSGFFYHRDWSPAQPGLNTR